MRSLLPNTALLIFTRSAGLEAREKPLAFRKKNARKVAQLLNQKVIKLAESTGLQYFVVNEALQQGVDFASRLDSAFSYIFAKGYQRVISVGNDCLGLTKAQLLAAAADLERQDFVVGPTQHGGLYLFGLNFNAYQNLDFYELPWQTSQLYANLLEDLHNNSYTVSIHAPAWEVNHVFDWNIALNQVKHLRDFINQLRNLLSDYASINFNYLASSIFSFLFQIQERGPPRS